MPDPSTSDPLIARLRDSGWTVDRYSILFVSRRARVWVVVGQNGEHRLLATGSSEDEAWYWAVDQAEALGMLRREA